MEDDLKQHLEGMEQRITERIRNVEQHADSTGRRIETVQQHLGAMEQRITDRIRNVEQHVEAMERRFENVEQHVEAMERRIETVEQHAEATEQRLTERIRDVETTLLTEFHKWATPAELRQRSHAAALRALDAELEAASDRIKKLEDNSAA